MNRFSRAAAVAAVMATALLGAAAGTATSTKVVPFTAKYSGTAVVKLVDNVAYITATGTGTGTLLGAGKISGKGTGDSSARPCVPFGGPGTLTGTAGTKLTFKVLLGSQGCGDEEGEVFSVSGRISIVSGAGKLAKAKGSLKFVGVYDRGKGTFSVKFIGSLTV